MSELGINKTNFIDRVGPSFNRLSSDDYVPKFLQIAFLKKKFQSQSARLDSFIHQYYKDSQKINQVEDLLNKLTPVEKAEFEKITPCRQRSVARFILSKKNGLWLEERISSGPFVQKTGDARELNRFFDEMEESVANDVDFIKIIKGIGQLVNENNPSINKLDIFIHQYRIIAEPNNPGNSTPEGIHQDGFDYILGAALIARTNVSGAATSVYGPEKNIPLISREIAPGECLFFKDKNTDIWHDATLLKSADNKNKGFRDFFSYSIDCIN